MGQAESRKQIRELVECHAPSSGVHSTPFKGVEFFRMTEPVARVPGVYSPCLCIIVAGRKVALIEDQRHVYDENRLMCAT